MKTALITGVTGQDGCYLAKNLLEKGYKVYGAVKHTTGIQNWRLDEMGITNDIEYVDVDIVDQANIRRMIDKTNQMKYIIWLLNRLLHCLLNNLKWQL